MANVVIKRHVAAHNVDAFNRSVKADVDVENGSVFQLLTRSNVEGEDEVWVATAPVAADNYDLWMAKSSEVVLTTVPVDGGDALNFKGIVEDPRAFTNVKGYVFDAFKPQIGDIIEMTLGDTNSNGTDKYLVPSPNAFGLVSAADEGTGFTLKEVGQSILHIGSAKLVKAPVKTYIYEVVNN